jgi:threonine dehydrogenase-like Zn-dependent dehydrogenase
MPNMEKIEKIVHETAGTLVTRMIARTCKRCRRVLPPGTREAKCDRCRAKHRQYCATKRQKRVASGLCMNCGRPAVPGKKSCEKHLGYYRKYAKELRERLRRNPGPLLLPATFPTIDLAPALDLPRKQG